MHESVGACDYMYRDQENPLQDGAEVTYEVAAEWLKGLDVEDWGCGLAWFRRYATGRYLGIDGSESRFCDRTADLTKYVSNTPGLLLRHVLEHNYNWPAILDNAVASF